MPSDAASILPLAFDVSTYMLPLARRSVTTRDLLLLCTCPFTAREPGDTNSTRRSSDLDPAPDRRPEMTETMREQFFPEGVGVWGK